MSGDEVRRRVLRALMGVGFVVAAALSAGVFAEAVRTGELYLRIGFALMVVVAAMAGSTFHATRPPVRGDDDAP